MLTRRRCLALSGVLAATGLLSACEESRAFHGIDITGADYAQAFQLVDHHGQARQLSDFKGKAVIVFFGYTQCPDVCPTSLMEMAEAKRLLGEDGDKMQGLFVTVDPARDTPEIMKAYMAAFDPTFLALYAPNDGLKKLAEDFRIYFKKVDGPTPTSYTMDHSAGSYVYDAEGRLRLYHRHASGAQGLADDIRQLLKGK